jgi:hypothetical protein
MIQHRTRDGGAWAAGRSGQIRAAGPSPVPVADGGSACLSVHVSPSCCPRIMVLWWILYGLGGCFTGSPLLDKANSPIAAWNLYEAVLRGCDTAAPAGTALTAAVCICAWEWRGHARGAVGDRSFCGKHDGRESSNASRAHQKSTKQCSCPAGVCSVLTFPRPQLSRPRVVLQAITSPRGRLRVRVPLGAHKAGERAVCMRAWEASGRSEREEG